jgi:PAS domain S-box-containing protein
MGDAHSNSDLEKLQARFHQVAGEKAVLQLILQMIEKLNPLNDIEVLVEGILHGIMDTIGGTNSKLYYWDGPELHCQDFLAGRRTVATLDDPLAQQVFERRTHVEEMTSFQGALLQGGVIPNACSWGFPLKAGDELLGIVTIENLHIPSRVLGKYLPVFFDHTALILSNELRRKNSERAEQALREKSAELDNYFNNARDLFAIADTDGYFRKLNSMWGSVLEYPPGSLEGTRFLDLVHPEDLPATLAAVATLSNQKPVIDFVNRYRHADGSWRWIEWHATAQGSVIYAAARDITERRKSEEALTEQENRLRAVFESSQDAIGVSEQGIHNLVNPAYLSMFGFERSEELVGTPILNLIAPESRELIQANIRARAMGEPAPAEYELMAQRKDGSTFRMEVHASAYEQRGAMHTVVSLRDITERKRAEEAIEASRQELDRFFTLVPDLVCIASTGGYFKKLNLAWERTLGFSILELMEAPYESFIHPEDLELTRQVVRKQIVGQEMINFVNRYRTREGGYRLLEWMATPALGGFVFFAVARDITERTRLDEERRKLEAQVSRTQKMESLGSLAGGVAHDMNNVLGAIMALASVHQLKASVDAPLGKDMETIIKACKRGGTLVKGLLGFSREQLAEERELDLNALVRDEVALLERTTLQKVRLELDQAHGLKLIKGDPAALSHALMNLCVNAVDAMPEGGSLRLRTRNDGAMVLLEVEDSGSGMPKDVLEKALDPFFTTKPLGKGTGLGLSIVYGTVKAHHGKLEIQSEPGQGTKVLLRFPACEPLPTVSADAGGSGVLNSRRGLSVLVVDDDELVQASNQAILEAIGHRVTTVPGGEEALAQVEAGLEPDLVILDMNMPGLDGAATLPRLRLLRPELPILLTTGRADQAARDLMITHSRVALLLKPFTMEDLERNLEMLTRG